MYKLKINVAPTHVPGTIVDEKSTEKVHVPAAASLPPQPITLSKPVSLPDKALVNEDDVWTQVSKQVSAEEATLSHHTTSTLAALDRTQQAAAAARAQAKAAREKAIQEKKQKQVEAAAKKQKEQEEQESEEHERVSTAISQVTVASPSHTATPTPTTSTSTSTSTSHPLPNLDDWACKIVRPTSKKQRKMMGNWTDGKRDTPQPQQQQHKKEHQHQHESIVEDNHADIHESTTVSQPSSPIKKPAIHVSTPPITSHIAPHSPTSNAALVGDYRFTSQQLRDVLRLNNERLIIQLLHLQQSSHPTAAELLTKYASPQSTFIADQILSIPNLMH